MADGRSFVQFPRWGHRGLSLVEVVLVLLVVAVAGAGLYAYLGETKKSLDTLKTERPINHARLAADLATLAGIRNQLDVYYASHGQWPQSREAVASLLRPAPGFQCAGNDYTYDPATGAVGLVNMDDPGRC
jgi:prepilin-type N-terminal cleavage/methylation domain-containing protein